MRLPRASASRRPRPKRRDKPSQGARRISPLTLGLAALILGAIAFVAFFPSSPSTPTRPMAATPPARTPTPVRVVTPPTETQATTPTPGEEAEEALSQEEVSLDEPLSGVRRFEIPVRHANLAHDPLALYRAYTARPKAQKRTKPSVPMPPRVGALDPTPWIEQWVGSVDLRYVAYVRGRRPGAVVALRSGETVVFAGQTFPGEPSVRVLQITPDKIVLAAKGKRTEVTR